MSIPRDTDGKLLTFEGRQMERVGSVTVGTRMTLEPLIRGRTRTFRSDTGTDGRWTTSNTNYGSSFHSFFRRLRFFHGSNTHSPSSRPQKTCNDSTFPTPTRSVRSKNPWSERRRPTNLMPNHCNKMRSKSRWFHGVLFRPRVRPRTLRLGGKGHRGTKQPLQLPSLTRPDDTSGDYRRTTTV